MSVVVHELEVRHGHEVLVQVAGLPLHPGRPLTIVGESGSGKSLLAHALMGTVDRSLQVRGHATIDGGRVDLAEVAGRRSLWGRVLAMLPQEPGQALDPTMRVGRQVGEGVRSPSTSRASQRAETEQALDDVGLRGVGRAYPHHLSGGMSQRVAFAAATIGGARTLIADEPSKGLDPPARDALVALLRRHAGRGGSLLTVTHDLDVARAIGGQVWVMQRAHVVEQGDAERVLDRPRHAYTRRLVAAEPAGWRYAWQEGDRPGPGSTPLLEARDLGHAYGSNRLFSDLTVDLGAGERLALTGPSGAGKTTLGNVLLRLQRPSVGTVDHSAALAPGRVQKLYQDPGASFPRHVPTGTAIADVVRRHRVDGSRLDALVETMGLPPGVLTRRPGQVSGGELQRLALIRALLLDPLLLFADEPTSRLDLVTQQETVNCLMQQVEATGCALVLVTHDEPLARAVCDRTLAVGPAAVTPGT